MKRIARFVVRDSDDKNDGLFIGALFKEHNTFKKGKVYEIQEILGEFIIKEVGDSAITTKRKDSPFDISWGSDISTILDVCGKRFCFTMKEMINLIKSEGKCQ